MGVDQTEEYRNIRENRERECQSSGGDDQGRVRSCFDDSPASVFDDVPAEQQKWLAAPFPCENLLFVFISEEKGNRTHHFSVKPGNENSGHSGTSSCADDEENRLSAACLRSISCCFRSASVLKRFFCGCARWCTTSSETCMARVGGSLCLDRHTA